MRLTYEGREVQIGDKITYTAGLRTVRTITVDTIEFDTFRECVVYDGRTEDGQAVWGTKDQIIAHTPASQ